MANEKRLIDANELLKDAEDYGPIRGGLADLYDVKWLVNAQLTVDAVEVVHGRWIHDINNLYGCSECGERQTMSPKKQKNYCPNCGAKMDGGTDNERTD